jgi:uncharacterized integral membrane protein (TIGR00698 family)
VAEDGQPAQAARTLAWWTLGIGCVAALAWFRLAPAWAMAVGLAVGLTFHAPYGVPGRTVSRYMLQAAVVLLGFRLNAEVLWQTSSAHVMQVGGTVLGALFTGLWLGRRLHLEDNLARLIAAGTAICGGSAIAALAPVLRARAEHVAVAIAVVFSLNAVALFVFPPLGHWLGLSQTQFALWAAVAIHDTSSVVGAAAHYGNVALETATTLKLGRALWIIPVVVGFAWTSRERSAKVRIPPFIVLFVLASLVGTWLPDVWPAAASARRIGGEIAAVLLIGCLFLIGAEFNGSTLRRVQPAALVQAVLLWAVVGLVGLGLARWSQ